MALFVTLSTRTQSFITAELLSYTEAPFPDIYEHINNIFSHAKLERAYNKVILLTYCDN